VRPCGFAAGIHAIHWAIPRHSKAISARSIKMGKGRPDNGEVARDCASTSGRWAHPI
jgi:hypothetical protein